MEALKHIEDRFGRVRSLPNASRTLDLDLIALGRQVVDQPDVEAPASPGPIFAASSWGHLPRSPRIGVIQR